jgi:ATP-binding cassette subfamily F protein 3
LVVSHDRRLLETVCTRLWIVDEGVAVAFDGGYREWRLAAAAGWTARNAAEQAAALRLAPARTAPVAAVSPGRRAVREPVAVTPGGRIVGAGRGPRREKLSKDAYRRQRATLDSDLSRLGLRKSHLELAMADPAVAANFVELRRVASELADVNAALATAEDAWLELEDRAP